MMTPKERELLMLCGQSLWLSGKSMESIRARQIMNEIESEANGTVEQTPGDKLPCGCDSDLLVRSIRRNRSNGTEPWKTGEAWR